MNVAIALLLFRGLTGDAGLDGPRAAFATLFFVLAGADYGGPLPDRERRQRGARRSTCCCSGSSAGGRSGSGWCSASGFSIASSRFTARRPWSRSTPPGARSSPARRGGATPSRSAPRRWSGSPSSSFGISPRRPVPGTSTADLSTNLAANNLLQVAQRLCFDPRAVAAGAGRIFTVHWPELFGLEPQPLTDFGIESTVRQGLTGSAWLLVPVFGIPVVRVWTARASRLAPRTSRLLRLPDAGGGVLARRDI